MTGELVDLADLAARSGVPVPRLRQYAEVGLLPPARRDGDRPGYPPAEVDIVRILAGAEDLGLDTDTLGALAAVWRDGDCAGTRRHLAAAVTARLDQVQADVAVRNRQAVEAGPGTTGWAEKIGESASLSEDAARLQAVSAALTVAAHDGPCGDDCGCITALAVAGTTYQFPHDEGTGEAGLACDLVADGGEVRDRISVWQQVLGRVEHRAPLPDTADGVALRFPFDVDLAGTLGRLAAAEYRCCSFGSYTLVVDGTGLRLEIRMPAEAAGTLAAVVGLPETKR
ncbi:MerR family transcriptional regulator [Krasilnikovia sp. MM14-A1004]|uniref:helix-turn-helix domain-containing protein n=1 Tax=Krasilnikovia sp. MM14-A1004 TaxID=3373541 RepID=UPI00399C8566